MTLEALSVPEPEKSASSVFTMRVRDDGVAVVTYDVPGEPINTLKASFSKDFEALLIRIEKEARIKAAVLISGKADSFIAGADIEMLKAATTPSAAEALCRVGHQTVARLASSKKPIVAAINGPALGGGFEVALACQARVVSDDKKTVLGFPEVQLGILPGLNGLQRLAEKAGLQVALDYGLTGKNMRPAKAKQLGVADDVVSKAILEAVAVELAQRLASSVAKKNGSGVAKKNGKKPPLASELTRLALEENPVGRAILFKKARDMTQKRTHGHYPAPFAIIDVLRTFASSGFDASREVEAKAFGELATSDVARRLMDLFFATTALKKDSGVDDPSIKPRPIERVFVLGAGLMGSGIAYVTSIVGDMHVRMKDRDDAAVNRGLRQVSEIIDDRVKKKQMTRIERGQKLALMTVTTDDSGLHATDLVIEAVFEDLGVKHQVLEEVDARAKPGVIFASNTSSIPIGQIAAVAKHPENVVGMHYFSPVHKMPLLEVIRTEKTDPAVVATAVAVGKKQGKTVIVVGDGVGFYTTRVLAPYLNEACWLLTEGLSVELIDQALVDWGWPVGPLTLVDEVGIDVAAHVGRIMHEAFGARIEPPAVISRVVRDERRGRKNERGFYLYGDAAKRAGNGKHVDPTIYAALGLGKPSSHPKISAGDIQLRCSLQFVNEALLCFGERILRSARDGDVGAVLGLGFPPFRGGPFRLVDSMGPAEVLRRMRDYEQRFGKRWSPAPVLVEMAAEDRSFFS
ncbi:MAG TPA: fatty acid oxidation complex subunit alpha FadJ [Polyangiaceae bacterium]|nr:fatty acid oxidation complex subunit alpha FadJ [Polyangiaceae bacterium]